MGTCFDAFFLYQGVDAFNHLKPNRILAQSILIWHKVLVGGRWKQGAWDARLNAQYQATEEAAAYATDRSYRKHFISQA